MVCMILTAESDSNDGGQASAAPQPHGRAPARGGRCRTSGHRFGSERSHAARMPLRALRAAAVFRRVVLRLHAPVADRIRVIRLQRLMHRLTNHRHPPTDR